MKSKNHRLFDEVLNECGIINEEQMYKMYWVFEKTITLITKDVDEMKNVFREFINMDPLQHIKEYRIQKDKLENRRLEYYSITEMDDEVEFISKNPLKDAKQHAKNKGYDVLLVRLKKRCPMKYQLYQL